MGKFTDWVKNLEFGRWTDPGYDLDMPPEPKKDEVDRTAGVFNLVLSQAEEKEEKQKDVTAKPSMNVISKEEFEARVTAVFRAYYEVLAKSFGPFGANTIICKYPYNHTTKDGFTIAKSMSVDVSQGYTDQAIADMATDICGRINTAVGDGTTTAIICTNNIYQSYIKKKERLLSLGVAPRDVLSKFTELKGEIRKELESLARDIDVNLEEDDDIDYEGDEEPEVEHRHEYMVENIRKVVDISANGDSSITDNITGLYEMMGYPSISCEKSPNGEERVTIVSGYRSHVYLSDNVYVNSDGDVAKYYDADILIFECQITEDIYTNIIDPVLQLSVAADRHLIVCAPSYDNVVMDRMIIPKVSYEFAKTKDVKLVLTVAKMVQPYQKKELSDLAMLCHTTVLTRAFCTRLITELKRMEADSTSRDWVGSPVFKYTGITRRWVPNLNYPLLNLESSTYGVSSVDPIDLVDMAKSQNIFIPGIYDDTEGLHFDIGYARDIELGAKTSVMKEFFYDEDLYNLHMKEAEDDLAEVVNKYKKLGTFNIETTRARERLYSLKRQLAIIEVGGDSELSMGLRKDVYDDAIKAADSAYKYGTVLGCNVCTIGAIEELILQYRDRYEIQDNFDIDDELSWLLLAIIRDGFIETYRTILLNWMPDEVIVKDAKLSERHTADEIITDKCLGKLNDICRRRFRKNYDEVFEEIDGYTPKFIINDEAITVLDRICDSMTEEEIKTATADITFYDLIIAYSLDNDEKAFQVFDIMNKEFSEMIINSFQTDDEILNAVIDLLSLLISGNQMIVTQKRTFDE